ncbi:hypothetical protein RKD05_001174 [Microbacterium sp. SLBN-111]
MPSATPANDVDASDVPSVRRNPITRSAGVPIPAAHAARTTHAPTTPKAAHAAATEGGRAVPTANIAIAITRCIGPAQFGTASPTGTTR